MRRSTTQKLVLAGFFLSLGLVMPFLTGQIPNLGRSLLPMHIPVLLCGFICGWPYGLAVGFIVPVFRSVLFGMPPMFPTAVAMSFELAVYGLMTGLLYAMLPKKPLYTYITLICAMIAGRIIWGIVSLFLYGIEGGSFTWSIFISGAVVNAIPGIILQIVLIPAIMIALKKSSPKALESA